MKIKKYNYGGKVEMGGAEVEVKAMTLEEAVKQVEAAVKAGSMKPTHYKIKA